MTTASALSILLEKHFRWLPHYKPQFWSERIVHRDPRYHDSAIGAMQSISPTYTQILAITRWKQHSGDESRNTLGADDGA